MAQVWEASDDVLARAVAVKILHPHLAADPSFVDRFRHEAIAAARLSHPSIVAIYDTVSDVDREAIVMELVPGMTLRQRLDTSSPLELREVVAIGEQVADALEVAHRAYLVHRDVKPANILLHPDGRVLVADFGIAKALQEGDRTEVGTMVGTAKYLAPEQVEGRRVDGRTDLYSLGVVLYECLCGRPPFVADTDAAMALARLHEQPLRPRQIHASIPREIDGVIMRALERDPADRYRSAAEFRASLLAALHGQPPQLVTAPPPVPTGGPPAPAGTAGAGPAGEPAAPAVGQVAITPAPTNRKGRDRGWLVTTVAVVLVAVALGVAGVLFGHTGAGRQLFGVKHEATPSNHPVAFTASDVHAFDPFGDRNENDAQLGNIVDDHSVGWQTEHYRDADFGGLKSGVGIYVVLDRPTEMTTLTVQSPSAGWSASIYVASAAPPEGADLSAWGNPVTSASGISAGQHTFDLGSVKGTAVLVWITKLARLDGGSCSSGALCWGVQLSQLELAS
jgi:serine/threonine-protein kinase